MLLKASARTIAVYQLLSAAAFVYVIASVIWSGQMQLLTVTVYAGLVLFSLFASIELLRSKRRGYWASLVNEALQIPSLYVPGFVYDYIGLGQVSLALRSKPPDYYFLFGFWQLRAPIRRDPGHDPDCRGSDFSFVRCRDLENVAHYASDRRSGTSGNSTATRTALGATL